MTGLLHRLAARANGTAWSVRSDSRLPFATEGLETAPTLAAQPPQAEPMPQPQPAMPNAAGPAQVAGAPTAVPPTPMLPSRLQQAPWPAPPNAPSAAPRPQAALRHGSLDPLANDAPSPPQLPTPHATGTQPAAAMSLASPLAPAARSAQPPAFTPFTQQRDPAPLLPDHQGAAPSAMPASPATHARAATWAGSVPPAAREDTEVHIHIGRIDVTAVHEAPKARPRARERAQPVSLHDYLATRKTT